MNKKFYIICLLVLLGSLLLTSMAFACSKPNSAVAFTEQHLTPKTQHTHLEKDCCKQDSLESCSDQDNCSDHQCQCLSHCAPVVAYLNTNTFPSLTLRTIYKPQFKAIDALVSDGFVAIWIPPLLG